MQKNNIGWISVIIAVVVCLLPCVAGLLLWNRLPDQIPIHYDAEGVADGFCGKLPGVLVLPVICVILCLVLALLLKRFMSENIRLFLSVLLVAPLLSVGLQFMILSNALGAQVNATAVSILIVGIFCIPIGNYLPTARPNSVVGARFPWIMDDPDAWEKTQRLTGKLMILWGVLMILAAIFNIGGEAGMIAIMMGGPLVLIVVCGVYSYQKAQE